MFDDTGVNLHVFTLGSPEITRMTRFRDRLRADRADRERYAAAKRELAGRRWRYLQDYADAKSDVVGEIMSRAMAPAIRPFEVGDAAELAALYAANRGHLRRFEPVRPDAFFTAAGQAQRARAEAASAAAGRRYAYVILDGTELAGTIAIDGVVRGAGQMATIGYWVDEARAGRGLGTRAVAAAVETAFEALELHRVQAGTLLDNRASQRVLEKNGFERFGMAPRYINIAGRWQDHFLYQRLAD
jgi:ribosomal-protein-alanine N-acetyltransferase